ncbi:MAG: helix-turn-helix domain-containing protein, partial [Burkholderiaceae bacterium]
ELRLPPLRERREDIPLLSAAILNRLSGGQRTVLSDAAMARLCTHAFPGNVRELENILERALALVPDRVIEPEDLQFESAVHLPDSTASGHDGMDQAGVGLPLCLRTHLYAVERALVRRALRQARFQRVQAAHLLGISLRQLRYRMQRLAIHEYD